MHSLPADERREFRSSCLPGPPRAAFSLRVSATLSLIDRGVALVVLRLRRCSASSQTQAAVIRTALEQYGELSAVRALRRLFPGRRRTCSRAETGLAGYWLPCDFLLSA